MSPHKPTSLSTPTVRVSIIVEAAFRVHPESCGAEQVKSKLTPQYSRAISYDDFLDRLLRTYCTEGLIGLSVRWMQPIQQHGRRTPSLSSVSTLSTCCLRVSGFFTEIVQQIHSLRARGVRSSHAASASASDARVVRKSSGKSWTAPPEISALVIYTMALSRKNCRS